MTRIGLALVAVLLVGCGHGAGTGAAAGATRLRSYPATSDRIQAMGRRIERDGRIEFAASGVTFFARFRGRLVDADIEELNGDSTAHNWFTVVVDSGEPVRFRTTRGLQRYHLATGLAPGEHTLALSKATEGQNGHERLVSLYTEELLGTPPLPERKIEFIGNSITAGYGADPRPIPCGVGTWYDKTHAWLAYGPRLARRLDAQWMLSAVSGIGMVRNWNSPGPVMPQAYAGLYMEYADTAGGWDFSRYTPDLVVLALGTNDFSDGGGPTPRPPLDSGAFVGNYTGFLTTVRARYPRARMLLLDSPMLDSARNRRLDDYLRRVVAERAAGGDSLVRQFAFAHRYISGCDGHPDREEQRAMADELEPTVRAMLGW